MDNITKLNSEQINQRSRHIDELSTIEMVSIINQEDHYVAEAVEKGLPQIAKMIDLAYSRLQQGGRLIYIGAGTSGRLGILDASECPPTYGVSYECVQGIIAGGQASIFKAQEGSEDDKEQGAKDLISISIGAEDLVIGIAASGRTPYVIGALDYAQGIGAATGCISCVGDSEIAKHADISIEIVTGAEVISGSTRMKAGTAQKMVLNMISTSVMIKLGKVYGNLMVDVKPTNEKLVARAKNLIQLALNCDNKKAAILYEESNHHVKTAILMDRLQTDRETCVNLLENHHDSLRKVLQNFDL